MTETPTSPPSGKQSGDTPQDRLAKLLPGDVTAAFLSSKVALESVAKESSASYVFWTFIAILVLCPFYFRFVTKAKSRFHIIFLTCSFAVFALSIAHVEFAAYFKEDIPRAVVQAFAIVLPIIWTYLVTQISVAALEYDTDQPAPQTNT